MPLVSHGYPISRPRWGGRAAAVRAHPHSDAPRRHPTKLLIGREGNDSAAGAKKAMPYLADLGTRTGKDPATDSPTGHPSLPHRPAISGGIGPPAWRPHR